MPPSGRQGHGGPGRAGGALGQDGVKRSSRERGSATPLGASWDPCAPKRPPRSRPGGHLGRKNRRDRLRTPSPRLRSPGPGPLATAQMSALPPRDTTGEERRAKNVISSPQVAAAPCLRPDPPPPQGPERQCVLHVQLEDPVHLYTVQHTPVEPLLCVRTLGTQRRQDRHLVVSLWGLHCRGGGRGGRWGEEGADQQIAEFTVCLNGHRWLKCWGPWVGGGVGGCQAGEVAMEDTKGRTMASASPGEEGLGHSPSCLPLTQLCDFG